MNKLFLYYSHTGNGDVVASNLQKRGYEIRKVERKKKLPKSFFALMMTGGFLAGIKAKDKLLDFDRNLEGYDEIVIGSPIWNGRFCSPLNGLLSKIDLTGKKVTFVFCSGSGEGPKAQKRLTKLCPDATSIFLKEPKKYPAELDKLSPLP